MAKNKTPKPWENTNLPPHTRSALAMAHGEPYVAQQIAKESVQQLATGKKRPHPANTIQGRLAKLDAEYWTARNAGNMDKAREVEVEVGNLQAALLARAISEQEEQARADVSAPDSAFGDLFTNPDHPLVDKPTADADDLPEPDAADQMAEALIGQNKMQGAEAEAFRALYGGARSKAQAARQKGAQEAKARRSEGRAGLPDVLAPGESYGG